MKTLLLTLSGLLLLAAPALADMTGSTGNIIGPGTALPGDTVTFIFEIANGSPDGEATSSVHFRFPETFTVLDGWYDDGGLGWEFDWAAYGDYGERIIFFDAGNDPTVGEIAPGTGGLFYVSVLVSSNTECGIYSFRWKQYGDKIGGYPHWMDGLLPYDICGIATEDATWSSVKSLY